MELKPLISELFQHDDSDLEKILAILIQKLLLTTKDGKNYYYRSEYRKEIFTFFELVGYHILCAHYYSPVPERHKLGKEFWAKTSQLIAKRFDGNKQLAFLKQWQKKFSAGYNSWPNNKTADPQQYYLINAMFEGFDAYVMYCLIRQYLPKRIIEIGAGFSTLLIKQAIKDSGKPIKLTSIEPFPRDFVKDQVVTKPVQGVELSVFEQLKPGDMLSIDSSHVLKADSDVHFEYSEILPRLKKGVIIHIHDIFFPNEYPAAFFNDLLFYNEQYLLQAILLNSDRFEIIWGGNYMKQQYPSELKKAFPNCPDNTKSPTPCSLWLKRI